MKETIYGFESCFVACLLLLGHRKIGVWVFSV
jgi:hypothetical protein